MHLVQRGHDRRTLFENSRDRHVVLGYIADALDAYKVSLHAYVLMDNHVHLLATGHQRGSLSRFMQAWTRRYGIYFNRSRRRGGTLYEGRFWSWPIHHERYFLTCMRYIELNPVRAGMCPHPARFSWSSYAENSRGWPRAPLSPHPAYLALGEEPPERAERYKQHVMANVPREEIEFFRAGIRPRKEGRPRKQQNVPGTFSLALEQADLGLGEVFLGAEED